MAVVDGIRVAHTGQLDAETLAAARAVLYAVFDDMTEHDWEHSLGGMHALAYDGGELVGHASVIQRRLLHNGRALRTGYVEGVAVLETHRRRGYFAGMMAELERIIVGAYDLGALGATDDAARLYAARGWRLWQGETYGLTPDGTVRTEDEDDCVFVFPAAATLNPTDPLTADWRPGDLW